jgi:hypothetical protein
MEQIVKVLTGRVLALLASQLWEEEVEELLPTEESETEDQAVPVEAPGAGQADQELTLEDRGLQGKETLEEMLDQEMVVMSLEQEAEALDRLVPPEATPLAQKK